MQPRKMGVIESNHLPVKNLTGTGKLPEYTTERYVQYCDNAENLTQKSSMAEHEIAYAGSIWPRTS